MSPTLRRLIVIAACFRAAPALAQWYWPPDFGLASDCTLSVSGQWPDSCTPRGPISVQVTTGRIDITIDHGYPAEAICLAVIRDWSATTALPPGTSGAYQVYLSFRSLSRPPIEPTLAGSVTVSCASACIADLDDGNGTGMSDGAVTIDDLVYFLARFEAGDTRADVAGADGQAGHDGAVTIEDLVLFLQRFEAGC